MYAVGLTHLKNILTSSSGEGTGGGNLLFLSMSAMRFTGYPLDSNAVETRLIPSSLPVSELGIFVARCMCRSNTNFLFPVMMRMKIQVSVSVSRQFR